MLCPQATVYMPITIPAADNEFVSRSRIAQGAKVANAIRSIILRRS